MTNTQIFWQNATAIEAIDSNIETVLQKLQETVNTFSEIGIKLNSIEEIKNLLTSNRHVDPVKLKTFVADRLNPDTPAGLNRARYLEMVDIPNLEPVKTALAPLANFLPGAHWRDTLYWKVYRVSKGRVYLDQEQIESIKQPFRESTNSDDEAQRLAAADQLCGLLEQIRHLRPDWMPEQFEIRNLAQWNGAKFEPQPGFVKSKKLITL